MLSESGHLSLSCFGCTLLLDATILLTQHSVDLALTRDVASLVLVVLDKTSLFGWSVFSSSFSFLGDHVSLWEAK